MRDHEANNATVGEIGNEFSLKYANELSISFSFERELSVAG